MSNEKEHSLKEIRAIMQGLNLTELQDHLALALPCPCSITPKLSEESFCEDEEISYHYTRPVTKDDVID